MILMAGSLQEWMHDGKVYEQTPTHGIVLRRALFWLGWGVGLQAKRNDVTI